MTDMLQNAPLEIITAAVRIGFYECMCAAAEGLEITCVGYFLVS